MFTRKQIFYQHTEINIEFKVTTNINITFKHFMSELYPQRSINHRYFVFQST